MRSSGPAVVANNLPNSHFGQYSSLAVPVTSAPYPELSITVESNYGTLDDTPPVGRMDVVRVRFLGDRRAECSGPDRRGEQRDRAAPAAVGGGELVDRRGGAALFHGKQQPVARQIFAPVVETIVEQRKDRSGRAGTVDEQVGLDPAAVGHHQAGKAAVGAHLSVGNASVPRAHAGARRVAKQQLPIGLRVEPERIIEARQQRALVLDRVDELVGARHRRGRGIEIERQRPARPPGARPLVLER